MTWLQQTSKDLLKKYVFDTHENSYLDCMIHHTASNETSVCVKLVPAQIVYGRHVEPPKCFRLLTLWCCPPRSFLSCPFWFFSFFCQGLAHAVYYFFLLPWAAAGCLNVLESNIRTAEIHELPLCEHTQPDKGKAGCWEVFFGSFVIELRHSGWTNWEPWFVWCWVNIGALLTWL